MFAIVHMECIVGSMDFTECLACRQRRNREIYCWINRLLSFMIDGNTSPFLCCCVAHCIWGLNRRLTNEKWENIKKVEGKRGEKSKKAQNKRNEESLSAFGIMVLYVKPGIPATNDNSVDWIFFRYGPHRTVSLLAPTFCFYWMMCQAIYSAT